MDGFDMQFAYVVIAVSITYLSVCILLHMLNPTPTPEEQSDLDTRLFEQVEEFRNDFS